MSFPDYSESHIPERRDDFCLVCHAEKEHLENVYGKMFFRCPNNCRREKPEDSWRKDNITC